MVFPFRCDSNLPATRFHGGHTVPIFADNSLTIGHTPLVQVNRLAAGLPGNVLAKIEETLPTA